MRLDGALGAGIEPLAHVVEQRGVAVALDSGAALASASHPYFNRTWAHFCSHQYTPIESESDEPFAVRHGACIYISKPLFGEYAASARRVHRQIIGNALALLLERPLVGAHTLPTTAIVTVRQQG